MTDVGKPILFSVDKWLDTVEGLIECDEVEKALLLLDNGPLYFTDHPTERMAEIRRSLHRQLWTSVQYKGIYDGVGVEEEQIIKNWPLRATLLEREIETLGHAHIMELAPGSKWIPWGLSYKKLTFSYESMSLDYHDKDAVYTEPWPIQSYVPSKVIFCAFEIIEHLQNPWEIYQNYLKFNREADIVMISTPLYSFGGGMPDWRNRPLGHLRTYSPHSLHALVSKMFLNYTWTCNSDYTIVLTGKKNG